MIYGVFGDGPLKGLRNGDRSYKLELKPTLNLGTYHVIDGQKVTAKYPGQQQTCARCFGTPSTCPGKGMARRCELENGPRMDFTQYIYDLWNRIDYCPSNVDLDPVINEDHAIQDGGMFTPVKRPDDNKEKFTGVSIKTFPKDTDHGDIVQFLIQSGLPETHKDNINIKQNGAVMINNLAGSQCEALIAAIHTKTHFGRRLFCNGIIPRTPDKAEVPPTPSVDQVNANSNIPIIPKC